MESGSDGESQERSELDVNEEVRKKSRKNEVEKKKTEKQFIISVKKEKKNIIRGKFSANKNTETRDSTNKTHEEERELDVGKNQLFKNSGQEDEYTAEVNFYKGCRSNSIKRQTRYYEDDT